MTKTNAAVAASAINIPPAGDFAAIYKMDSWTAEMLKDAYDAVTTANRWASMAHFTGESFMFSSEPWLSEVQTHMKLMDQHSGASYGWVMRVIESIARNSWETYVTEYVTHIKEKEAAAAARERADTEEGALDARRMGRRA